MTNTNYNLLKLLHLSLDNLWRIEKHYKEDASGTTCKCGDVIESIRGDLEKHVEMLKDELAKHQKEDQLA